LNGVREGCLDLSFVGHVVEPLPGVTAILYSRDSVLLAVPSRHPLARRKRIALAALQSEKFVAGQVDMGFRVFTDELFAACRVRPKIASEANNYQTVLDMVSHGLGIAIVPESQRTRGANVCFVRLQGHLPTWNVYLAFLGDQPANPAARIFLKMLLDHKVK
jgi:DNA-binding transcriptional LysR family regulator